MTTNLTLTPRESWKYLWDDNMIFVLPKKKKVITGPVEFFVFLKAQTHFMNSKNRSIWKERDDFSALISKAHYLSLLRKAWSYGCSSCWHGRHTTPMGVQLVSLSLSWILVLICMWIWILSVILSLSVNWVFWALMLFIVFLQFTFLKLGSLLPNQCGFHSLSSYLLYNCCLCVCNFSYICCLVLANVDIVCVLYWVI